MLMTTTNVYKVSVSSSSILWTMSVVFVWILMFFTTGQRGTVTVAFPSSQHQPTNNNNIHAMIVSSSRYWFNYRHAMNPLDVYQLLRNNGIPDDNIILMIADEYASNPRNPYKIRMHAMRIFQESWYDHQTEIDYRGADVTIQNVINALLGQAPKSLHSNADSNVLIYLTGHGGDQFFKFQDEEELTAQDIAKIVERIHLEHRYQQVLFLADTCQAFTLFLLVVSVGHLIRRHR